MARRDYRNEYWVAQWHIDSLYLEIGRRLLPLVTGFLLGVLVSFLVYIVSL